MSVAPAAPSGYLDFTNATPKAIKMIATSNIGVGTTVPAYALDVHGSANVGALSMTLPIAEVASNLVTYDKSTGQLFDSGGLFSNKLAVVSQQPPSALTANVTTVPKHGTYTLSTSGLAAGSNMWNAFDGDAGVSWIGISGAYTGESNTYSGTVQLDSQPGEWIAVEFPYKTTLRYMKLTPESTNSFPASANLYATNDSLVWTELTNWEDSTEQTIFVNASEAYKKYALVTTKVAGDSSYVALAEWKLFTESFSIDGGKVAMATSAVMGGETTMDQHGPHGRGEAKLKKYPEIAFDASKADTFANSNAYTQARYEISSTSRFSPSYDVLSVFNGTYLSDHFGSQSSAYSISSPFNYTLFTNNVTDKDSTQYTGEEIKIKLPNRIKLSKVHIVSYVGTSGRKAASGHIFGSNTGANGSWTKLVDFTGLNSGTSGHEIVSISTTEYYEWYSLVVTNLNGNEGILNIYELEYYGYEEDPPTGDTSVDTTFASIMNTPQTTGANVYADGNLGETFTNRVTGPDATGTATTYDSTGKYWELNGSLESNIAVEANTFLQGDAPHSVSVWFNSSNLEANVSNTCVFSVSDQEHLNSENLDLQSNTWHNLTYAYQGEGGSRVTYLDGRKVAEDQAEDTFGEYPPFAMTGFSQGGYVVSASNFTSSYYPWTVFDKLRGDVGEGWFTTGGLYTVGGDGAATSSATEFPIGSGRRGEYLDLEMPHKLKVDYFVIQTRDANHTKIPEDSPHEGYLYGSNDGVNWTEIKFFSGLTYGGASVNSAAEESVTVNSTTAYKYLRLQATKRGGANASDSYVGIGELKYYGHRENDLVRLPDPTRVLKYPHIAMTGPAQRGYVVTTSSSFTSDYDGHYALDETVSPANQQKSYWSSLGHYTSTGGWNTIYNLNEYKTIASGTTYYGDFIEVEFPNKITLNFITVHSVTTAQDMVNRLPSAGVVAGWNGSSWDAIQTYTSLSVSASTHNIINASASTAYSKIRLVVTAIHDSPEYEAIAIDVLRFYGTEENSPVPIQIGGGNIDKVANFRVYDKFIEEDQALEIWDAQKDLFREVKNSMTLHKGRLGIGTTEPEGRLAVLDEPDPDTYGLQEFPPKPLVGYKTHIEGHGIFKVYASQSLTGINGAVNLFDKKPVGSGGSFWLVGNGAGYNTSNGAYEGESGIIYRLANETSAGQYATLEMPYPIKLEKYSVGPRSGSDYQTSEDWELWGSNDGSSWTKLHNVVGNTEYKISVLYNAPQTNYYRYFGFVVTRTIMTGAPAGYDYLSVGELKFFGYREQVTKQSVLHDGQLTLTKNLTVPRIGPALDADDTPRRDRLVVEYNTSTNPIFEGAVRDTSGRGNDGVLYDGAYYDTLEKTLDISAYNGSAPAGSQTAHIKSGILPGFTGNQAHTMSFWIKTGSDIEGSFVTLSPQSGEDNYKVSMIYYEPTNNRFKIVGWSNDFYVNVSISTGELYHITLTYEGATVETTTKKLYINGVQQTNTTTSSEGSAINFTDTIVCFGEFVGGGGEISGQISNFKLYDCALTAGEVKTLYDMGRCDEGHHVVNFSKTRVGIGLGDGEAPTYTLDVRGQIRSQGSLVTSFTGQHKCVPEEPMETGLIVSAKKNQYVKLNGSLDTGKSAITIDESLPVVSLSNVVQDKACFGVVSSTEEANTVYRVETTNGGVISYIPKTLGDNRAIVNSVGEGAIWVVDTNGPLESGDYITTSNVAGYGQKQGDDVLHNYTVAKITMDCDFTGSNVAVQTIKREETGLHTITEDTWNELVDYDRSSNTETQYSNTLVPSAYSGQSGYTPREVTTIVDYTDGSNTISIEEWSNLESNIQNTYQSNTFTEIVDYTKFISLSEWSNLTVDVQNTYSEAEITTYYQIQRGENVLDENGQLQFEDKTGATEAPYERRFLDASGVQTDEANAVHIAAFVGCTYHCG
jgi:hypothetical protein